MRQQRREEGRRRDHEAWEGAGGGESDARRGGESEAGAREVCRMDKEEEGKKEKGEEKKRRGNKGKESKWKKRKKKKKKGQFRHFTTSI